MRKKLARPPGLRYIQSEWTSTQGHQAPRANFAFSHVNGSLLMIKKCMKNAIAEDGSVRRVTLGLLLGTTLLHINRPLQAATVGRNRNFIRTRKLCILNDTMSSRKFCLTNCRKEPELHSDSETHWQHIGLDCATTVCIFDWGSLTLSFCPPFVRMDCDE